MQRYTKAIAVFVAGVVVFTSGSVAGWRALGGDGDAGETIVVRLPGACDNFVAASEIFSQHGASAAISATGGDPLAVDAEKKAYETLRGLLESCDNELALRVK